MPVVFMDVCMCRFALLCGCVLDDVSVDEEKFCSELLPLLLNLKADSVPNVRLTVARAFVKPAARSGMLYFVRARKKINNKLIAIILKCKKNNDLAFLTKWKFEAFPMDSVSMTESPAIGRNLC